MGKPRKLPLEAKTKASVPKHVSFSFKYLAENDADFGTALCDKDWFVSFVERMRNLGTYTAEELQMPMRNDALRSHPITWNDTSRESFGIPREDELVDTPWQLTISRAKGRFHGFFVADTFHIVWLDPQHKLYPNK